MSFVPTNLIRKKRFGHAHSPAEIGFLIQGFARDEIPDYQMSAWLMAVCCKGMNNQETAWLTEEMRDSGKVLDLRHLGQTVDKHSTGGVGDKISLILAPLVAAAGVTVPMVAGRGLGHTGGTLDKLESIAGFNVKLTFAQFETQLAAIGTAIMGQSEEICPADRKLYALRDVTGTIDSLPLICGSIMSKKLAEGIDALVLDVKFGSGAFMKTLIDAEALARALITIGEHSGKKVLALLTRMDEPLGRRVGNALEVQECLDILANRPSTAPGKTYADVVELTLALAGPMIFFGGQATSPEHGLMLAKSLLASGAAEKKFFELCAHQAGDLTKPLPKANAQATLSGSAEGYMEYLDVEKVGLAAVLLGAGRKFHTDSIDPSAGIEVWRAQGDVVKPGDPIFTLFATDSARLESALPVLNESFKISTEPVRRSPLVAKVLT